ncbi:MAG: hypothetical protein ABFD81_13580 [Syntrophaceae bacterium]
MKKSLLIMVALLLMFPTAGIAQVCSDCVVVKIKYGPMSKAQADLLAAKIKNDNKTSVHADVTKVQIPCKTKPKKQVKRPVKKATAALQKKAAPIAQKNNTKPAMADPSKESTSPLLIALTTPSHHGDGAARMASSQGTSAGAYSGGSHNSDNAKGESTSEDVGATNKHHTHDDGYVDGDKHDRTKKSRHQSYKGNIPGDHHCDVRSHCEQANANGDNAGKRHDGNKNCHRSSVKGDTAGAHHGPLSSHCGLGNMSGDHHSGDPTGACVGKASGNSHGKSAKGLCGGGNHGRGPGHHR